MNYKIYDQLPQEAKEIRIKEITVNHLGLKSEASWLGLSIKVI